MTKRRTITAKNPDDLLAVVPRILGFHPEDSVVLLSLGSADDPFHARADLPDDHDERSELVARLSAMARRHRVRRGAIVVYSGETQLAEQVQVPLQEALGEAGVEVVAAIRADGSRWFWMPACGDACCPAEGTPYDVATHPFTAQSVFEGVVVLGSRRELQDSLVGVDLEEIEKVGRAADQAMDRFAQVAARPSDEATMAGVRAHLVLEGHWVAQRVRRFLRDGAPLRVAEVGRLLVALVAIEVRDVAWAEMTHENADQHVTLWRDVVRRSPPELIAAPAALLGFAAWIGGDGALAWCAVERCESAEPGYGLAGLLAQALAGGVPPSTWEPFDRRMLTLFAGSA
jgi:hypothetical protein